MKCLNCDNTKFTEKNVRMHSEYSGEPFDVVVPAHVCEKCEEKLLDSQQMNALRQATADAYRQKHKLLTSAEIVSLRKGMGKSQREFAEYLGVGDASIKRWETYYAQELAMDQHIRLKCIMEDAEQNVFDIEAAKKADISRGNREFSWERFVSATLILVEKCNSPLFINKALFYMDFLHFKRHGKGITGAQYSRLEFGPCPEEYRLLFRRMLNEGFLKEGKGPHGLSPAKKANWELFDDDEKATLVRIIDILSKKKGGQMLLDTSHTEDAFLKAPPYGVVDYRHAKKLKIS